MRVNIQFFHFVSNGRLSISKHVLAIKFLCCDPSVSAPLPIFKIEVTIFLISTTLKTLTFYCHAFAILSLMCHFFFFD